MSILVERGAYDERDDSLFLEEMNRLTLHHLEGCEKYTRMWPGWKQGHKLDDLPFVHVGVFKHMQLKTSSRNIKHRRILSSSSTSGISSQIALDEQSSKFQSISTTKILKDFLGEAKRPLMVLDSVASLRKRNQLSARIAAAISLQPLSSEIHFLLENADDPQSMKWDLLSNLLKDNEEILVYGFSWILWLAWGNMEFPSKIQSELKGKKIYFVHSGGWKKLETHKVNREIFDSALLSDLDSSSKVLDFYGLVEQIGIIYPLCEYGVRHVPVWADVLVRDSYTLEILIESIGQLQLLNAIASGAPYHSVLTEDIGRVLPGQCPCGRSGKRFELLGRIPKAELRGCANV